MTLGSYSAASADNVKALVLDQRFLLENRTPTRGPLSGVLLSKSTALLIPPRDNTDVMVGRRITASNLVIFLHRGALDECFDFEMNDLTFGRSRGGLARPLLWRAPHTIA